MSALDVCSVCVYICMYVIDNCVYLRLSQRWADQQRDHQKKEKVPPYPFTNRKIAFKAAHPISDSIENFLRLSGFTTHIRVSCFQVREQKLSFWNFTTNSKHRFFLAFLVHSRQSRHRPGIRQKSPYIYQEDCTSRKLWSISNPEIVWSLLEICTASLQQSQYRRPTQGS